MRVRTIAALAAGIVVSALLVAGPAHAQSDGAKPFVGFGFTQYSGRATGRASVPGASVQEDADYSGRAHEVQFGLSQIGGTGMFTYLSVGRVHYDVEWLGIKVSDKETMVFLNVGHEWDVGGARPWLALSVGKVNDVAYGIRGGYKFRLGENFLFGPRVDLIVVDNDETAQVGALRLTGEDTKLFGIGMDFQYRFNLPGSR